MQDAVHILYDHVPHFVGRVAQSVWVPDRITVGTGFSPQPPVEWVPGRAADHSLPSSATVHKHGNVQRFKFAGRLEFSVGQWAV